MAYCTVIPVSSTAYSQTIAKGTYDTHCKVLLRCDAVVGAVRDQGAGLLSVQACAQKKQLKKNLADVKPDAAGR